MQINKEILINELDLPSSAIEDKIISLDRWTVAHEIIFEYKGKFYRTWYSEGATEYQDEGPWEFDEIVDCEEVEQREVLVKQWFKVDDDKDDDDKEDDDKEDDDKEDDDKEDDDKEDGVWVARWLTHY